MANEISLFPAPLLSGASNLYARLWNSMGQVANLETEAVETYNPANAASYPVALTEVNGPSGYYLGDFPTWGLAGIWWAIPFKQVGDAAAWNDPPIGGPGRIDWSGNVQLGLQDVLLQFGILEGTGEWTTAMSIANIYALIVAAMGEGFSGQSLVAIYNALQASSASFTSQCALSGSFALYRGAYYGPSQSNQKLLEITGYANSLADATLSLIDPGSLTAIPGIAVSYVSTVGSVQTVELVIDGSVTAVWPQGQEYPFWLWAVINGEPLPPPIAGTFTVY